MAKKLPYSDGDLIAVPLRDDSGYAVGLVAANDGRGGIVGYFFDRVFPVTPVVDEASDLGHCHVLRVMRFGDLGLLTGDWAVLGQRARWDPKDWPIPVFGRRDPNGRAYRVIYSPYDLTGPLREEVTDDIECDSLPRDVLSGSGAVERVLTQLLSDVA